MTLGSGMTLGAGRLRARHGAQHQEPRQRGGDGPGEHADADFGRVLRPANASMPMNRLMVKPMPPSMATPKAAASVAPSGLPASLSRSPPASSPNTPSGLPRNSPSAMPMRDGAGELRQRQAGERHAGVGEGEQRQHDERHPGMQAVFQLLQQRPLLAGLRRSGIASATTTPASVACTPDFSTHTQRTARRARKAAMRPTPSAIEHHQHGDADSGERQRQQRQAPRCRTRR